MAAAQHLCDAACMLHRRIVMHNLVVLIDLKSVGMHNGGIWVFGYNLEGFTQEQWFPQIILIKKSQKFSLCEPSPIIAGRSLTAVLSATNIQDICMLLY